MAKKQRQFCYFIKFSLQSYIFELLVKETVTPKSDVRTVQLIELVSEGVRGKLVHKGDMLLKATLFKSKNAVKEKNQK